MPSDTTETILVIDDDAYVGELVKAGLKDNARSIVYVSSGISGLAYLADHKVDLVLLDVHMPGMEGFEVCQCIRQNPDTHRVPVIMLTGADDIQSIERSFELGATDFMGKPINLPLLRQRVRFALRSTRQERHLAEAYDLQRHASQLAGMGYWTFSFTKQTFQWLGMNDALSIELPTGLDSVIGLVHRDDRTRVKSTLLGHQGLTRELHIEFRINVPNLGSRIIRAVGGTHSGQQDVLIGAFQDITKQRTTEDMLEYLRLHDDLTGLPNRRLLIQSLPGFVGTLAENDACGYLAFIELRESTLLSSALTQSTFERLLHLLADRLKQHTDISSFALQDGRFGLLISARDPATAEQQVRHVQQSLECEYTVEKQPVLITIAAGIIALNGSLSTEQTLQQAQLALDLSIENPELPVCWGSTLAVHDGKKIINNDNTIKKAIANGEFSLFYQPQLDLSSNHILGAEALLRWYFPEQDRFRSPIEFLPSVERLGLMRHLGRFVLFSAFQQAKGLYDAGWKGRVGVNLAAQQFLDPSLVSIIQSALDETGATPAMIELEITESTAMADPQQSISALNELKNMGFSIAIDDFGIGYSSMEYLLKFPVTSLKIDRSFVIDITTNAKMRTIVRTLTTLARGLGLTTICEGVEDQRQRDYVDALGVDYLQGYLISKPLPIERLRPFIQSYGLSCNHE